MAVSRVFLSGMCLFGTLVLAAPAMAAPPGIEASSPMRLGPPVAIPIGYYNLCVSQPSVCRPRGGRVRQTGEGAVRATPELFEQLQAVSVSVNRSIRPIADPDTPGLREWRVNAAAGNCKDYALAKRQRLMAAGLPSSAVLVAIARLGSGVQHAVLIVRTDHGDYVLDNLDDRIRPWMQTSYRWEKIQSPTETWVWYAL